MSNVYFIVEPEQIVAQDLAHAIRTCDPLAEVNLIRQVDELVAALVHVRPKAVILHADPARFRATTARQALVETGIPLGFLGTMAEAQPEGEAVLASPFSEATVATFLRRLVGLAAEMGG